MRAVRELRRRFPNTPIIADLKTMDGGYLEAEMMAQAGATLVVVMAVSHPATIQAVVAAERQYGIGVMGDVLAATDRVQAAKDLERAGVDVVIAHLGFDERHALGGSPLDFLSDIVQAVDVPVQAVGGLTLNDFRLPKMGAPLVVVGAPLAIDNHTIAPATEAGAIRRILAEVVRAVKGD